MRTIGFAVAAIPASTFMTIAPGHFDRPDSIVKER